MRALLRRELFPSLRRILRGGKKKKGAQAAQPEIISEDIVNIFKERKDPQILPSEMYPPWLFELLKANPYTFHDRKLQMFYGRFMPSPRESYSYYKSNQRVRLKMKNIRKLDLLDGDSDQDEPDPTPYVGTKYKEEQEDDEVIDPEAAGAGEEGGEEDEEGGEEEEGKKQKKKK